MHTEQLIRPTSADVLHVDLTAPPDTTPPTAVPSRPPAARPTVLARFIDRRRASDAVHRRRIDPAFPHHGSVAPHLHLGLRTMR